MDPSKPAALHLHLDVAAGARSDAILGALLDLLPDEGPPAVTDALGALGLPDARLAVERVRAHGVNVRVPRLVVDGTALDPSPMIAVPQRRRRERPFAFVRDARARTALAPVSTATQPHPDAEPQRVRARGRTSSRGSSPGGKRAPTVLVAWQSGARARPKDLIVAVRASALSTVQKALALRACARLVEALGAVRGDVDDAIWEGPAAVRALAHIAACSALVEALDPDLVSASAVAVSSTSVADDGVAFGPLAPSPWVEAVLQGAPCVEDELGVCPVDVVGAVLVRTLASRFGARGWFSTTRQGFGALLLDGMPSVTRALIGPMRSLPTRAGDAARSTDVVVGARLELGFDREALARALYAAGARDHVAWPVDDGDRRAVATSAVVPPRGLDAAVVALWAAGAVSVSTTPSETRRPGVEEVTVPVGRGRNRQAVRVRVIVDDTGSVLSASPMLDDVRAAARAQRRPEEVVRADAIAAWSRLTSSGGA